MTDEIQIADQTSSPQGFRFPVAYLFYVMALIASAIAAFGPNSGTALASMIGLFWAVVFFSGYRPRAFTAGVLIVLGLMCLIFMAAPVISVNRGASRRAQCVNNLRQILIALHNYHDHYKSFPPAYFADENGKPTHSWRVLILPFLGEESLYDQYRFDEPWDGPNNRKLHNAAVWAFRCPSQQKSPGEKRTTYFAVVGPKTAFPGAKPRAMGEVLDGLSDTVMIVEGEPRGRHWMEPVDLSFDEALHQFTTLSGDEGHRGETYFYEYRYGRNVGFGDGRVEFVPLAIPTSTWAKMLNASDGLPISQDEWVGRGRSIERLKVDRVVAATCFAIVVLFPLPWVWLKPRRRSGGRRDQTLITGYRHGN